MIRRTIARATLVAGTLDILSAFFFGWMAGRTPMAVLGGVASGPFGEQATQGGVWAIVGLAVHFAIMAAMVTAYVLIAPRIALVRDNPIPAGLAYGVLLWLIMYWVVLPLRFGAPLPSDALAIAKQLFSHCILTGLPIALITAREHRKRTTAPA